MAVLSIDGLDILTGKPAEDSKKGYIVDAYSSTEIKGYRLSDTDSAAFVFTSKGKSYVSKTAGEARNTGVIGVRIFREKEEPVKVVERIVEKTKYVDRPYPVWTSPYNPWNPYYCGTPHVQYGSILCDSSSHIGSVTTENHAGALTVTSNAVGNVTLNNSDGTSFAVAANNVSLTSAQAGVKGAAASGQYFPSLTENESSRGISARSYKSYTKPAKLSAAKNDFDSPITQDSFDTGTSFGKKQVDKVKKEYFNLGPVISEIVFYYATRQALENMGVDFDETPAVADVLPSAFGESKYCLPPKDWRG